VDEQGFEILTEIAGIETIAAGRGIRDLRGWSKATATADGVS
jgi:hypothetical protein